MQIKFTWSPTKAKRNSAKHHISFAAAKQVFFDPHLIVVEDCEIDGGLRYHAIGYAHSQLLLAVVFLDRSTDDQEIIHIISARKAEAYEEQTYSDQF